MEFCKVLQSLCTAIYKKKNKSDTFMCNMAPFKIDSYVLKCLLKAIK